MKKFATYGLFGFSLVLLNDSLVSYGFQAPVEHSIIPLNQGIPGGALATAAGVSFIMAIFLLTET